MVSQFYSRTYREIIFFSVQPLCAARAVWLQVSTAESYTYEYIMVGYIIITMALPLDGISIFPAHEPGEHFRMTSYMIKSTIPNMSLPKNDYF